MDHGKPIRDEHVKMFVLVFGVVDHRILSVQNMEQLLGTSSSFLSILSSLTARVATVNSRKGTNSDLRSAKQVLANEQ